jgi:hypothetical protein
MPCLSRIALTASRVTSLAMPRPRRSSRVATPPTPPILTGRASNSASRKYILALPSTPLVRYRTLQRAANQGYGYWHVLDAMLVTGLGNKTRNRILAASAIF